jgi:hypothetical protein
MFCSLLPVLGLKVFIKSWSDSTVDNIYKSTISRLRIIEDYDLKESKRLASATVGRVFRSEKVK